MNNTKQLTQWLLEGARNGVTKIEVYPEVYAKYAKARLTIAITVVPSEIKKELQIEYKDIKYIKYKPNMSKKRLI